MHIKTLIIILLNTKKLKSYFIYMWNQPEFTDEIIQKYMLIHGEPKKDSNLRRQNYLNYKIRVHDTQSKT